MRRDFRILFLNPPFLPFYSRGQRSPSVTRSGTLYYPLWILYACGNLRKYGFDAKVIDAPAEGLSLKDVKRIVKDSNPSLLFIETSTPSIYNDLEVSETLKATFPDILIFMTGTHVSALPKETLEMAPYIDGILRGEYELTALELAQRIALGSEWKGIKGISYREGNETVNNPPAPFIEDLDSLPFISEVIRENLNPRNYFNPNVLYPMIMIITGRGCPNRCTFCLFPQVMTGRRMRTRSIESVVNEFEYVTKYMPYIKGIFIEDDTFTQIPERCIEFSEQLLRKGIKISWTANARISLDYRTMKIMKRAGLRCLCVGFESANDRILENMKKGIRSEMAKEFMENAKRAGIRIHGCFIFGAPGEDRETMKETLNLALSMPMETAQFYPMIVYPGTEAYEEAVRAGNLLSNNFREWLTPKGNLNCVVRTEKLSPEEIFEYCDYARRKFYLRPGYLFKKFFDICFYPSERVRIMRAFRTFYKYLS